MAFPNFLLVAFPAQSHINPALQFAKRLVYIGGAEVTFATAESALRHMAEHNDPPIKGRLSFAGLRDGTIDGFKEENDMDKYMEDVKHHGSECLKELILSNLNKGQRFNHVFFTILIPWLADVAHSFGIESTFLWIQPALVFDIYYYYFNGYKDVIENACNDPSSSQIQLPRLPTLNGREVPTFLSPSCPYTSTVLLWQHHFQLIKKETNPKPKVLVNTFDALEMAELKAIDKLDLIAVGPLIPSAFSDGLDPSDTSFGGDLVSKPAEYRDWLNMKDKESVVYVSFGSFTTLSKLQKEEMARALLEIGRPFLWVIRKSGNEEDELSCLEDLEKLGMIVPWCSQVEVLSHPSIGCFVSHCGWNSTSESLVCGVPMIAFPQWSDQHMNAQLVEDVWKTGVKVSVNEDGVAEGREIKRCLELVLGDDDEKGQELRKNAAKWKHLAREACKEGGSSYKNLKAYLEEIMRLFVPEIVLEQPVASISAKRQAPTGKGT